MRLKKGCLEEVRAWFRTLKEREAETLQTLELEKVYVESVFLEKSGQEDFLIYYLRAENIAYAREVAKQSLLPIDLFHKDCMQKFCENSEILETLLDLKAP